MGRALRTDVGGYVYHGCKRVKGVRNLYFKNNSDILKTWEEH